MACSVRIPALRALRAADIDSLEVTGPGLQPAEPRQMSKVGWTWRGQSIGKEKGWRKRPPPFVPVNCSASEVVLERDLPDARPAAGLAGDGSEAGAAAGRV